MGHKRHIAPERQLQGDELTAAMAGIGMSYSSPETSTVNIEDTLLAASEEGLERDPLGTAALLSTWMAVHASWVNADRLTAIVLDQPSQRVLAFWSATAKSRAKDRRFARLAKAFSGPRMDLLPSGTETLVLREGEDPRFAGSALRVPASVLQGRRTEVITPSQLARIHRTYCFRVLLGPTYRADMWAALIADPTLSAAELARRTYGSFATAWQAKQDFMVLGEAGWPL